MADDKKKHKIIIPKNGIASGKNNPRAVYDPVTSTMIGLLGVTETQRASHVEPGSELSQKALDVLWLNPKTSNTVQRDDTTIGDDVWRKQISPDYSSHWFADMTPTGHDVVLGPYPPDQRDQALADEVKWLHEHNIPTCGPCTEKSDDTAVDK